MPRFLGGDVDERFFVMTDLGDGQSLEAILQRKDKEVALATLRDLAICMARLHAATLITEETTEEAFATIRHRLPDAAGLGRQAEAAHWRQQAPKMRQWFAAAAVPLPAGFMACLQRIADLYACPGPFLAFTHGDPAPSNNHIGAKQVHYIFQPPQKRPKSSVSRRSHKRRKNTPIVVIESTESRNDKTTLCATLNRIDALHVSPLFVPNWASLATASFAQAKQRHGKI